ncbi:MAG: hypothetical protein U0996_25470 [Planctomycetaceae bacterium]
MEYSDDDLVNDVALFASEIHYCLLNGGVRSRSMKRLGRLARKNPDLAQVLDIKVAEFQRVLREERIPTLWNLPARITEWMSDRAKFTAPREIVTTLAYVVFAVVAVDTVKTRVPWKALANRVLNGDHYVAANSNEEFDLFSIPEARPRIRFSEPADSLGTEPILTSVSPQNAEKKLSPVEELDAMISERILHVMETPEFREALIKKLADAQGTSPAKPDDKMVREIIRNELESHGKTQAGDNPNPVVPVSPDASVQVNPASAAPETTVVPGASTEVPVESPVAATAAATTQGGP